MDEREESAALRTFLESRDAPCPNCGYNLRGLTAEACPECKHALRLQLERVDRPSARVYAFVVALGILGTLQGGWSTFQWVFNYANRGLSPLSAGYTVIMGISAVLELWLTIICVLGLARIVVQRNTSELGAAMNRFVGRLLAFLFVSLALGLAMAVGQMFHWI